MAKIILITAQLIEEADEKDNKSLKNEIMRELKKPIIPWVKKINDVIIMTC